MRVIFRWFTTYNTKLVAACAAKTVVSASCLFSKRHGYATASRGVEVLRSQTCTESELSAALSRGSFQLRLVGFASAY